MHVVVIGAGVIGVTTAYYLSELGCQVTVVDRASDVARGASYANAGQLSYSFTDALAKPRFLFRIPGIVAGRDRGYRVRLTPELIPWGLRFLSQCTNRRAQQNTLAVLKAALRSETLMQELHKRVPFEFSHRAAGKLVLLHSGADVREARANAALKMQLGCETDVLSRQAAIEIEPALASMDENFTAAVYSQRDSVADSRLFTVGLKKMLEKSGRVAFRLSETVKRLHKEGNRLQSIELAQGRLSADAVVVCNGAWSGQLLKSVGINPHVYPVKGYSVTLPARDAAPQASVTVLNKKIVFSRMNGDLRIAGFADFKGLGSERDSERIDTLLAVARDAAPLAADYESSERTTWGGFRPMTPNGQPLVGPSRIEGLYLNTGHGMLGWTLACASGHDIAHSIVSSPRKE
ncbi:MAG: FAD-dependent oxidoreductase [Woeseiaceae bacterium]|nr:FAD-dependent oxidoreductase [Woeseiaceae bacterium]